MRIKVQYMYNEDQYKIEIMIHYLLIIGSIRGQETHLPFIYVCIILQGVDRINGKYRISYQKIKLRNLNESIVKIAKIPNEISYFLSVATFLKVT